MTQQVVSDEQLALLEMVQRMAKGSELAGEWQWQWPVQVQHNGGAHHVYWFTEPKLAVEEYRRLSAVRLPGQVVTLQATVVIAQSPTYED